MTKIKLRNDLSNREDGGNLDIPPLQSFADGMTCVIEKNKRNQLIMKKIFESINEGKKKISRIGSNHDIVTPLTNKVKFEYNISFKLLGVKIDNSLKNKFVEKSKKKICTKIAIWRKLNLSEVGNLNMWRLS